MNNKNNRVLWLLNHSTLQDVEIPILRKLGFEVYTCKIVPPDEKNLSVKVDYSHDETLTIPFALLQDLNRHDFYSDPLNEHLSGIINTYFGTAIIPFFDNFLLEIPQKFTGRILFRAFGTNMPATYSAKLKYVLGNDFDDILRKISGRCWLAQAYPNILEIEEPFLRRQVVTLPVGLSAAKLSDPSAWTGAENRLLFVCSRIMTSDYYNNIYQEFKKHFGDLPHIIAGRQLLPVNDENAPGGPDGVPENVYQLWLRNSRAMFYHSQEPRHLHYHPLEAIACKTPLIFMKGGLLEKHSAIDQPGACSTISEAKEKIIRVLNLDMDFIKEIQAAQASILTAFREEFIYPVWYNNFRQIINTPL